jgi:hypothetical protein
MEELFGLISLDDQSMLVGLVVLLLVLWLKNRPKNLPPGPFQWPVIGSLPDLVLNNASDPLEYFRHNNKKYNGLFTLKLGEKTVVCIGDLEIMKEALTKQGDVFNQRPITEFSQILGHQGPEEAGIGFIIGSTWQTNRRFAMQAMRDFGVGKKSLEEKIIAEAGFLI